MCVGIPEGWGLCENGYMWQHSICTCVNIMLYEHMSATTVEIYLKSKWEIILENFSLGSRREKWGKGVTKYINTPQSIFKQQREPFIAL